MTQRQRSKSVDRCASEPDGPHHTGAPIGSYEPRQIDAGVYRTCRDECDFKAVCAHVSLHGDARLYAARPNWARRLHRLDLGDDHTSRRRLSQGCGWWGRLL